MVKIIQCQGHNGVADIYPPSCNSNNNSGFSRISENNSSTNSGSCYQNCWSVSYHICHVHRSDVGFCIFDRWQLIFLHSIRSCSHVFIFFPKGDVHNEFILQLLYRFPFISLLAFLNTLDLISFFIFWKRYQFLKNYDSKSFETKP